MNTMSEPSQTNEHDMNNMENMTHDSSASGHEGNTGGDHGSQDGSHESIGSSHDSRGSVHDASESSHDSGDSGGHNSGSGGHGRAPQDPDTPPNWPVIYGFGAFNLLVILAAALLKTKA
ncbi:hypothetical protein [Desulforamulus hydrothermalis]|uniref:hypothetical protein n=1 Tax=Desulforamulus hydrothermalis TaxID=412895 RepID=UPI001160325E|nr:hypothetical protein [Desulforamulus hydrothermalis]